MVPWFRTDQIRTFFFSPNSRFWFLNNQLAASNQPINDGSSWHTNGHSSWRHTTTHVSSCLVLCFAVPCYFSSLKTRTTKWWCFFFGGVEGIVIEMPLSILNIKIIFQTKTANSCVKEGQTTTKKHHCDNPIEIIKKKKKHPKFSIMVEKLQKWGGIYL